MKKWAFDLKNGKKNSKIDDDEPSYHLKWTKTT